MINVKVRFSSSLQICLIEGYAMKIVEVTIGHFQPKLGQNWGFCFEILEKVYVQSTPLI